MSAFRRRTQFAAPLIISLAACSSSKGPESPPPKQYPGTIWYVMNEPGGDCKATETELGCPKGVMCNPPPPSESKCPPFADGQNWANVAKKKDGTCAVLPSGCFDESCLGAAAPCPLPIGEALPKDDKPAP